MILGKKLSFSTAYHPQEDGLAERMIQTLVDMIRGFCAYGLELKDPDGFTNDFFALISALELAHETSIHASTGKTPAMLEKDGTLNFQLILWRNIWLILIRLLQALIYCLIK
ncbi:hypothetical protein O181_061916 [Austropuccinia psidii MF-1]|uniref:Integrase catalytic domain-containing protein n=1 Tax=Austropuccinia psidii MF-1 TaxID=1389203 RepID=A0A9Q3ENR6_9BASI|nr:hypothetical protein [Austropuccinia psidii MF-1]